MPAESNDSKALHRACYDCLMSIFKHYPHLATLLFTYVAATLLFVLIGPTQIHAFIEPWGIGGVFIAGMMYTISITAAAAAFILPIFTLDYSPATIAIIGGLGSTLVDITLLHLVRSDLKTELKRFGALPTIQGIKKALPLLKKKWFRNMLGLAVIALPVPDEIGIAFIANSSISEANFRIVGFIANTIGIYALVSVVGVLY